jgi:6-phosphogluconolactonase
VGYDLNVHSGKLRQLGDSPFPGVFAPYSLGFDLSGSLLYVINNQQGSVSGFAVDKSSGALSPVAGSPFPAGSGPTSLAVLNNVQH